MSIETFKGKVEAALPPEEKEFDPKDERKAVLASGIVNHCPLGCKIEDLDEYGYCHHLVGFTNDKRYYEQVKPLMRSNADGSKFDTGFKTVVGGKRGRDRQPLVEGDLLVNPDIKQIIDGIERLGHKWVSWRVYRNAKEATDKTTRQLAKAS